MEILWLNHRIWYDINPATKTWLTCYSDSNQLSFVFAPIVLHLSLNIYNLARFAQWWATCICWGWVARNNDKRLNDDNKNYHLKTQGELIRFFAALTTMPLWLHTWAVDWLLLGLAILTYHIWMWQNYSTINSFSKFEILRSDLSDRSYEHWQRGS